MQEVCDVLFRMGWGVTVYRKGSDHLVPAVSEDEAGEILALWSAVTEGVGWIEEACAAGDARLLVDGWYPSVFTMPARVLAGVIAGEAPEGCRQGRSFPEGGVGVVEPEFRWHPEVAAKVQPEEWLILTVIDTS
jgi:hypothetical protein